MAKTAPQLDRALSLYRATALVVGSVIGSGIFVSTAGMARMLPHGWQLMGVWAFTGLMTIVGALTESEICARMPVTGGLYAYFRAVFGDTIAFFYGWANFMIAGSGAIAAIAYIFASYLGEFVPLWRAPTHWQNWTVVIPHVGTLYPGADLGVKLVGSALIIFLTFINVRGVRLGSLVQSLSTTAKILALAVIVLAAFLFGNGDWRHLSQALPSVESGSAMALVGLWFAAMGGAFWSYDGWGNVAYVGGEIKNANKNLPRAIILGVGIVMTVYLLVNLAYMYVLPLRDVMHAPENRVASLMMSTVAGKGGAVFIALLIVLSTFDTVNSTILTNGRVYYAMAMEKLFWKRASYVHPQYHTPSVSLWLQGGWAVVLLISGSFDLITSMYVFVNWLFYFLIPVALFILRFRDKRSQANATTFRVPLYPILPIFFALFTAAYVVQTFLLDIKAFSIGASPTIQSLMGLLLVAAGLPFYLRLRARRR